MTSTVKRVTVGAALGAALFMSAGVGIANAQPSDGQVDLVLGTAGVLEDVTLGAAAQIAAGVCDREIAQVTPVVENVDVTGAQQNVCSNTLGAVDFRQNEAEDVGAAEQQPEATEETTPAEETPTTTPEETEAPAEETG
jgi:hypothetical protein